MARPVGSTTRPQFHTYTTEEDRKEFAAWVRENYKYDPMLAKWYGDQMFGKAVQPIGGHDGGPLFSFDDETKEKAREAWKGIVG
jgi:hypothetical protein